MSSLGSSSGLPGVSPAAGTPHVGRVSSTDPDRRQREERERRQRKQTPHDEVELHAESIANDEPASSSDDVPLDSPPAPDASLSAEPRHPHIDVQG